jgi:hypothetical protein
MHFVFWSIKIKIAQHEIPYSYRLCRNGCRLRKTKRGFHRFAWQRFHRPGSADSVVVDFSNVENYLYTGPVDASAIDILDEDCALLVYPTESQIEDMKKEYGDDDFYTIADDSQFYQASAIEKLDSAGIRQVVSNVKNFVRFKGADREWTLDVRKKGFPEWHIIFFKKDKAPKIVYGVDVRTDSIKAYFN